MAKRNCAKKMRHMQRWEKQRRERNAVVDVDATHSRASYVLFCVDWLTHRAFFQYSRAPWIACNSIFLRTTRIITVHGGCTCAENRLRLYTTVIRRNVYFLFRFHIPSVERSIFCSAFWICVSFQLFFSSFFILFFTVPRAQHDSMRRLLAMHRQFSDTFFSAVFVLWVFMGCVCVSVLSLVRACISSPTSRSIASIFSVALLASSVCRTLSTCALASYIYVMGNNNVRMHRGNNILFLPWNWNWKICNVHNRFTEF